MSHLFAICGHESPVIGGLGTVTGGSPESLGFMSRVGLWSVTWKGRFGGYRGYRVYRLPSTVYRRLDTPCVTIGLALRVAIGRLPVPVAMASQSKRIKLIQPDDSARPSLIPKPAIPKIWK